MEFKLDPLKKKKKAREIGRAFQISPSGISQNSVFGIKLACSGTWLNKFEYIINFSISVGPREPLKTFE